MSENLGEFELLLGHAALRLWSELPREVQEKLFETAVPLDPVIRNRLAVFLHDRHPRTAHPPKPTELAWLFWQMATNKSSRSAFRNAPELAGDRCMKVALYARYSTDNQRDASISDQFRVCRAYAEKQGWQIVEEYSDHAISGASLLRAGIQALIAEALRGRFQVVLAEAMDRLSRDQEDIAGLFKRMAYANVKIVTLSEGDVTHLHVGLKGTMNALFLKDLADKTRRGLRGRVELGKSGGGNSYGYDVVKQFQTSGEPIRGDRIINPAEAEVVRRIFHDYVVGKSAKRIAAELNKDGISAPSGGDWGFSTINGNAKRGNGILNNEMYIGRIVWNRQRFIKDPETGKRRDQIRRLSG